MEVRRFGDVDAQFAWTEGEGDRTLEYWREAHIRFFAAEGRPLKQWTRSADLLPTIGTAD